MRWTSEDWICDDLQSFFSKKTKTSSYHLDLFNSFLSLEKRVRYWLSFFLCLELMEKDADNIWSNQRGVFFSFWLDNIGNIEWRQITYHRHPLCRNRDGVLWKIKRPYGLSDPESDCILICRTISIAATVGRSESCYIPKDVVLDLKQLAPFGVDWKLQNSLSS